VSPQRSGEQGQVTAFFVVFTAGLIVLAGLVWDGGNLLAARREALDTAEEAARAGAQGIDLLAVRTGQPIRLDPDRAAALARTHLRQVQAAGTVKATEQQVTVTVTVVQPVVLLGGGGRTVTGAGTARPVPTIP
jgi:Flp pilus assembly protein TadG